MVNNGTLHGADVRTGCYAIIPGVQNNYGYVPSLAAGIVFCTIFAISMAGHFVQGVRKIRWTSFLLAIGALVEVIGWAGRTWSSQCPYNDSAFLMQITTLIIAPTFFSAVAYIILGHLIRLLGRSSSLISPMAYLYVFCSGDLVSLITQAVGGGKASIAQHSGSNTKPGTDIMVAGIVFQMATIVLFVFFLVDFLHRTRPMAFSKGVRLVILAMVISVTAIFIRSIYRTAELSQGWTGYLITHEGYFLALDAAIMAIAVGVYNIIDPAVLLPPSTMSTESSVNSKFTYNGAGH